VPVREFLAPDLSVVISFDDRDRDRERFYRQTQPVGHVHVENNIVVNNVIEVDYIERQVDREVVVYEVEQVDDPQQATAEDGAVRAYQPEIADAEPDEKPEQVADKEEVAAEKRADADEDAPAEDQAQTEDGEAPAEDQAQ